MQGSMKSKHLAFLLIPLVAACTTPDRTRESAITPQAQPQQAWQFDNCSVGCPSGGSSLFLCLLFGGSSCGGGSTLHCANIET